MGKVGAPGFDAAGDYLHRVSRVDQSYELRPNASGAESHSASNFHFSDLLRTCCACNVE